MRSFRMGHMTEVYIMYCTPVYIQWLMCTETCSLSPYFSNIYTRGVRVHGESVSAVSGMPFCSASSGITVDHEPHIYYCTS